jgi:hypothetical protein
MLAAIRQEFESASQERQAELAQEAVNLVNAAAVDGLIDYDKSIQWLQNALPGAIIKTGN